MLFPHRCTCFVIMLPPTLLTAPIYTEISTFLIKNSIDVNAYKQSDLSYLGRLHVSSQNVNHLCIYNRP